MVVVALVVGVLSSGRDRDGCRGSGRGIGNGSCRGSGCENSHVGSGVSVVGGVVVVIDVVVVQVVGTLVWQR